MPRASLAAIVLSGCAAEAWAPIAVDQLGLAVTVEDGAIGESGWVLPGSTAHFDAGSGAVLLFRFEANQFEYRGEGTWTDHLPSLSLEGMGCPRCYAPLEVEPSPAYPGETCPIPAAVPSSAHPEGALDRVAIEELQRRARLGWPGSARPGCLRIGVVGASPQPSERFVAWLATARPIAGDVTIDRAALAELDLLIVRSLGRSYTSTESDALAAWVADGGAVMALSGFGMPSEPERVNALLAGLGVAYSGAEATGTLSFGEHAVSRRVAPMLVVGTHQVRATRPDVAFSPVAFLRGEVVAAAIEHGQGRAVLWGDEFVMADELYATPPARMFWANTLSWLAR